MNPNTLIAECGEYSLWLTEDGRLVIEKGQKRVWQSDAEDLKLLAEEVEKQAERIVKLETSCGDIGTSGVHLFEVAAKRIAELENDLGERIAKLEADKQPAECIPDHRITADCSIPVEDVPRTCVGHRADGSRIEPRAGYCTQHNCNFEVCDGAPHEPKAQERDYPERCPECGNYRAYEYGHCDSCSKYQPEEPKAQEELTPFEEGLVSRVRELEAENAELRENEKAHIGMHYGSQLEMDKMDRLIKENAALQGRIDKAMNYIKNNPFSCSVLLNILTQDKLSD